MFIFLIYEDLMILLLEILLLVYMLLDIDVNIGIYIVCNYWY